ncbi:hypothetical protein Dalk_3553 [Desulfatibacillum aliphaticivorans]|uniref:Uncharacterized protein n=1 Tax=Desulfatibacillum aliphaticivorans TaxID=218208 RepID=B8FC36_DESAL|nr:capsid cement protein [Desulfatibacillum aliphaticivorans]ACL05241.1 hypothetical protein Dalk_3553 [Desulfatibacillum aliphaticivorans]
MAGVQSKPAGRLSRQAARDLSDYQHHAAVINTDGEFDYGDSSAGAVVLGVLQNAPDAQGRVAEIATAGTSLLRVDGASVNIAPGDHLGSNSNYHGVKVSADDDLFFAVALEAATADDDLIEVMLLGPRYLGVSA